MVATIEELSVSSFLQKCLYQSLVSSMVYNQIEKVTLDLQSIKFFEFFKN